MRSPDFLGLSTGRAGSRYLTKMLNLAGIPTVHERTGKDVDQIEEWAHSGFVGEVSAHLVMGGYTDKWPDAQVFHFTRHPQEFVLSMEKFGFWRQNHKRVHPYVRREGPSDRADSYRYWVDWNIEILKIPEPRRITFPIEGFDAGLLRELGRRIGRDNLNDVKDLGWKPHGKWAPIHEDVFDEVKPLMDLFGYEVQQPNK